MYSQKNACQGLLNKEADTTFLLKVLELIPVCQKLGGITVLLMLFPQSITTDYY